MSRRTPFSLVFRSGLCAVTLGLGLGAPLPAPAADNVHVSARSSLSGVRIEASGPVAADAATLWETLTDYNRLTAFVPDLRVSRVVSAPDKPKVVEQRADAGLLAFAIPDHVVLAMEEHPPRLIRFRAVAGNVAAMNGEWVIQGQDKPVRLVYRSHVQPRLPPPPLVSDYFVESEVRKRFEAVVREAERRMRTKLAPTPAPAPRGWPGYR